MEPAYLSQLSRSERIAAAAVALVFVSAALLRIYTQAPWCDEAWFFTPSLNLLRSGHMGTSNVDPTKPFLLGIDKHTYYMPPLYCLMVAAWCKVVGFGLYRARLLALLFGMVGSASFYLVVLYLTKNARTAWLAAGANALTFTFLFSASTNRMETACFAFGSMSLACYLWQREKHLGGAILVSETLVVASGLTHAIGILYFVALHYLIWHYDRERLTWRRTAAAAIPYCVGGVGWGLYILQAPHDFAAQFFGNLTHHQAGFSLAHLADVKSEVTGRYLSYFGLFGMRSSPLIRLRGLQLGLYVAAIAVAVTVGSIRRGPAGAMILKMTGIVWLALMLADPSRTWTYLIHILPWFSAVVSVCAVWLLQRKPYRPLVWIALASFALLQLGGLLHVARRDQMHTSYMPAVSYLLQNAPAPQTIFGSSELGFVLGFDERLIDDATLGFWSGRSARLVVLDQGWRDNQKCSGGLLCDHILRVLNECSQPVFHNFGYTIFRCPDAREP